MGFSYQLSVVCDKCGNGFAYKPVNYKRDLPSIDDVKRFTKNDGWKIIKDENSASSVYKVYCPQCAKHYK